MQNEEYAKIKEELAKRLEAERQLNILLRKIATQAARERLKNVKLVNQELYYKAVQYMIMLIQSAQLSAPITEEDVKKILEKVSGKKKEFRIIRK